MLLDNAEFLTQLKALFESTTKSGSVFLTQKRLTYEETPTGTKDADTDMPEASTSASPSAGQPALGEGEEREYPVIIKATDGKNPSSKTKISTVVRPEDHTTFMAAYGLLLKTSFNTMRKKDKKKRKEQLQLKSGAGAGGSGAVGKKAAINLRTTVIPKVFGARRGAGHAKRQRAEKARRRAVKRMLDIRRRQSKKEKTAKTSRPVEAAKV